MNEMRPTPVPHLEPALLRTLAYIDGAWCAAESGEVFDITNPADGSLLATVPDMREGETRRAIETANAALPAWRARTGKDRAAILHRWFTLIMENQDALGRLMTAEQGKPLAEAKGEVAYGAAFIEWFAEEAKRVYGDTIPGHAPDKRIVVIKQPVGVTAGITPWNFPHRHDYPQGRPGPGRRLYHGAQTRRRNPLVRPGAG